MRILAIFGVFHVAAAPLSAQPARDADAVRPSTASTMDAGQTDRIERRWAVTRDASVRFSGSIGTLIVEGWDHDSVVIAGTVPRGARLEGGVAGDGRAPARGAKMFLETPNDAVAGGASLTLRVPAHARVWVKSGTARVEVRKLQGGADVNVIGGSVVVAGSPRELQVEAMDASVVIDGSPQWLRVKTATGAISVRGDTPDVALSSVSGEVRLERGTVERGRIETVTGNIVVAARLGRGGDVVVDTHGGGTRFHLPAEGDFTLTASSVTGTIENRYDSRRPIAGREGRGAELSVGRGLERARVSIRSFKGTITILPPAGAEFGEEARKPR